MEFIPITPKDYDAFRDFERYKSQSAENSFANLCAYGRYLNSEYCIEDDALFVRVHFEYGKHICYYMPLCSDDKMCENLSKIMKDSHEKGYVLNLIVEQNDFPYPCFEGKFSFAENRNMFEYVYLKEDLASLTGKRFQPKRNHVNQFLNHYKYNFRLIDGNDKAICMDFFSSWREKEMTISPEYSRDYEDEKFVIEYLFDNFDALGMFGGGIFEGDKMVAFSIGSGINADTFDTNIEKADRDYIGSYAIINKEMAMNIDAKYKYINREEDKGIIGLRKAKLSYHPIKMIEKYIVSEMDNSRATEHVGYEL